MNFPAGSMLTVLRAISGLDEHGDPIGDGEYTEVGEIGPCDCPRNSGGHRDEGQDRDVNTIPVSAPVRSDQPRPLKTDRIRLPDGTVAAISSDVVAPTNPFTGWIPFIRFTLTEVI